MDSTSSVLGYGGLALGAAALVAAFAALRMATCRSAASAGHAFVIQETYGVYDFLKQRTTVFDPVRDVQRLEDEVRLVQRKALFIEQAGCAQHMMALLESQAVFATVRARLEKTLKGGGTPTLDDSTAIVAAAEEMDRRLQNVVQALERALRSAFDGALPRA